MSLEKRAEGYLLKFQSLTGLDCHFFLASSFWIAVRQFFSSLVGLVITLAFVHLGTKTLFGQYNLLLSLVALISVFSLPDFNTAVFESVSKGYDSSFKKGLKLRLFWSLLTPLAALVLGWRYLNEQPAVGQTLLVISLCLPFFYSLSIYSYLLAAKKKFKILAKFKSLNSLFNALCFVLGLLFFQSIVPTFFFYIFLSAFSDGLFCLFSLKYIDSQKNDSRLIRYGYFLNGLSFISRLAAHLDKILLSSFLGLESLAVYAAAAKITRTVKDQVLSFSMPPSVKIASFSEKRARLAIKDHFGKLVFIGLFLSLGLWLAIPWIIKLLFSQDYFLAVGYARLLSAGFIFEPVNLLFSNYLTLQKKQRLRLAASLILPLVKICFYFIFLPLWGVKGLIVSQLAEQFLLFLLAVKTVFK